MLAELFTEQKQRVIETISPCGIYFVVLRLIEERKKKVLPAQRKLIGRYEFETVNNLTNGPLTFLDLPPTSTSTPILMCNMIVEDEFRGLGYSRILLQSAFRWLETQTAIHVVAFSNMGRERLQKAFERQGYTYCAIKDEAKMHSFLRPGYSGWLQKMYKRS